MTRSIEEIEAELREAKRQQKLAQEQLAATVPPKYVFTVEPVKNPNSWDRLFDDTMKLYVISGTCVNREESATAGNYVAPDGSMRYVYNTRTYKLVCSVGGGTSYVSRWHFDGTDYEAETMQKISDFLLHQPEGGDITDIIEAHRAAQKGKF